MIVKTLKLRKEDFGWLACDISDCNTYEISTEAMKIISFLKSISREDLIGEDLFQMFAKNKSDETITEAAFEEILDELKTLGWINGKV